MGGDEGARVEASLCSRDSLAGSRFCSALDSHQGNDLRYICSTTADPLPALAAHDQRFCSCSSQIYLFSSSHVCPTAATNGTALGGAPVGTGNCV